MQNHLPINWQLYVDDQSACRSARVGQCPTISVGGATGLHTEEAGASLHTGAAEMAPVEKLLKNMESADRLEELARQEILRSGATAQFL